MMKGFLQTLAFSMNFFFLGHLENNSPEKTIDLFEKLPFKPNEHIYTIVLNGCSDLANEKSIHLSKKVLDEIPRNFWKNPILVHSAIQMLMKIGHVDRAEQIFHRIEEKNVDSYIIMMNGSLENAHYSS